MTYFIWFLFHHRKIYVHYLFKLLTYGHQTCMIGVSDMAAPTGTFTRLTYFQNVKILLGQKGDTNRNRCTQTFVILHSQTYWWPELSSQDGNYASPTYFTGQNRPPKKVGVNRHCQASWAEPHIPYDVCRLLLPPPSSSSYTGNPLSNTTTCRFAFKNVSWILSFQSF